MSSSFVSQFEQLPINVAEQIHAIANRFEAAWQKQSQRISIDSYLNCIDPKWQSALVYELLCIENENLKKRGTKPDRLAMAQMYPRFRGAVLTAIADTEPEFQVDSAHKSMATTDDDQVLIFGKYQVGSELGKGTFGVVYEAVDLHLNKRVALKIPCKSAIRNPQLIERFVREAQLASKLRHPNIVPVCDANVVDGQPYIASELVNGDSLQRLLKSGKTWTQGETAKFIEQLARALHYAHERGIVHRDVKPDNILVDADDQPQLTDFGLARLSDAETSATNSGMQIGSYCYMSPEQIMGNSHLADCRTDVWALGVVLFEMLNGERPFSGNTLAIQRKILDVDAKFRTGKQINRDLQTICLRCLEKQPSDRYDTALELAEDLRRFLSHEPIRARQIGMFSRLFKWGRRNKLAFCSMVVCTFVLIFSAVVSGFFAYNEHQRSQQLLAQSQLLQYQTEELEAKNLELKQVLDREIDEQINVLKEGFVFYRMAAEVPKLSTNDYARATSRFLRSKAETSIKGYLEKNRERLGVYHASRIMFFLAFINHDKKNYDAALKSYLSARELLKGDDDSDVTAERAIQQKSLLADIVENVGSIYSSQKDYDNSLDYFLESKEIREQLLQDHPQEPKYECKLAKCLDKLVFLENELGTPEEDLKYSLQSNELWLSQFKKTNAHHSSVGFCQLRIAGALVNLDRNDESKAFIEQAIQFLESGVEANPKNKTNVKELCTGLKYAIGLARQLDDVPLLQLLQKRLAETNDKLDKENGAANETVAADKDLSKPLT